MDLIRILWNKACIHKYLKEICWFDIFAVSLLDTFKRSSSQIVKKIFSKVVLLLQINILHNKYSFPKLFKYCKLKFSAQLLFMEVLYISSLPCEATSMAEQLSVFLSNSSLCLTNKHLPVNLGGLITLAVYTIDAGKISKDFWMMIA